MDSISQVVLQHYQKAAMQTSSSWNAILAEPIARFLATASADNDLRKSLRDIDYSNDAVKDMAHNRQFLKRHLENGQLRADILPFLIKFAPDSDDLLHDVCGLLGVLPVSLNNIGGGDCDTAYCLESIGKFNENSGHLTTVFSKMVISDGGLGPEDKPYVPSIVKFADRVVSWANNMKLQATQLLD